MQVRIAGRERERILREELPQRGVVIPRAIVVQTGFLVELAAGVSKAMLDGGIRFGNDFAETVVFQVVNDSSRRIDNIADRELMIGKRPEDVAARILVS